MYLSIFFLNITMNHGHNQPAHFPAQTRQGGCLKQRGSIGFSATNEPGVSASCHCTHWLARRSDMLFSPRLSILWWGTRSVSAVAVSSAPVDTIMWCGTRSVTAVPVSSAPGDTVMWCGTRSVSAVRVAVSSAPVDTVVRWRH